MSEAEVTTKGLTVNEAKAKKFVELVEGGEEPKKAAKEVGMTLKALKRSGMLARACRELLERVEEEKLLEKKTRETIARARLLELAMQDEDLKVALGAVKTELEVGKPSVAIQFNQNLVSDPGVIESLKSLQLEIEEDEKG